MALVNYTYPTTSSLLGNEASPVLRQPHGITVSYTIGAEAADVITVACQFKNADGTDCTSPVVVQQYLATSATGQALSTAPSGGTAAGTDGTFLVEDVAQLVWTAVSEADGDLDVAITEAGAYTTFLITVLPCGTISASSAITFAA